MPTDKVKRPRFVPRALHGVLLVDKPVGPSSHAVLGHARRLWRADKAGHTGTLDPLASGLLPVCFGAATKYAQLGLEADKAYRATVHLGQTRVGGDREGEVLRERAYDHVTLDDVQAACRAWVGPVTQHPPMHSALKHEGKPLYEWARQGVTIARATRTVTIHSLDVVSYDAPSLVIDVACSKGTYIRTLAEDLGEALGCGAHLSALRRTRTGPFSLFQSVRLDEAESWSEAERDAHLLAIDSLLEGTPAVDLSAAEAGRFLTGMRIRQTRDDAAQIKVFGPAVHDDATHQRRFLGTAHVVANEIIPTRLLSPLEVQAQVLQVQTQALQATPI